MSVEISEAEFESILVEKRQLSANLTACQELCNEQLEELRMFRRGSKEDFCAEVARHFERHMMQAADAGNVSKCRDFALKAEAAWDCARSIQIGKVDVL